VRVLVIPDLHNHIENADYWLETQQYDRVVFLGDYFDDFEDNVTDARRTAFWLRRRMENAPDDVFLLGNHDVAYMFPDQDELYCPGFTKQKAKAISEILQPKHWHRFKLAHEEQGWLLSHAGFHPVWMENPTVPEILGRCDQAMELAKRGKVDPILGYGEKPGGLQRYGGPLWMAWEHFVPISGVSQIVGHTAGSEIRKNCTPSSANYCIDVGNGTLAAVISNQEFSPLRSNRTASIQ
jgi:hypothetical protein